MLCGDSMLSKISMTLRISKGRESNARLRRLRRYAHYYRCRSYLRALRLGDGDGVRRHWQTRDRSGNGEKRLTLAALHSAAPGPSGSPRFLQDLQRGARIPLAFCGFPTSALSTRDHGLEVNDGQAFLYQALLSDIDLMIDGIRHSHTTSCQQYCHEREIWG